MAPPIHCPLYYCPVVVEVQWRWGRWPISNSHTMPEMSKGINYQMTLLKLLYFVLLLLLVQLLRNRIREPKNRKTSKSSYRIRVFLPEGRLLSLGEMKRPATGRQRKPTHKDFKKISKTLINMKWIFTSRLATTSLFRSIPPPSSSSSWVWEDVDQQERKKASPGRHPPTFSISSLLDNNYWPFALGKVENWTQSLGKSAATANFSASKIEGDAAVDTIWRWKPLWLFIPIEVWALGNNFIAAP